MDSFIFSILFGLVLGPAFVNAPIFTLEGISRSVLTMLFTVGFWINFVGTPGKLLLGCQVVDADSFEIMNTRQAGRMRGGEIGSFCNAFFYNLNPNDN